ncbi:MAG: DUF58 domain-containing protein [Candidatus Electryonea clarkiae]|nr:DUF58 domain-containing protein [Candidatus Electryonea clarkiae]MDP8287509.1 DUF58 domain-containing protein [Candidatus Electryonea clarkiae]
MTTRELVKKVRTIEIRTRGAVRELFSGEYHSAFKGRGIEFSEVREYVPGDDVRTIDWNVTAREGRPFIKLFEEERELVVMLLVDVSASGQFGSVALLKRDLMAELAAVLGFSAIRNQDKVGLILFSDKLELYVPPKKGTTHGLRMIRDLLAYEPESRGTDLSIGLEALLRVQPKKSIVFLISDFQNGNKWFDSAKITARKHDFVALHIIDPREKQIPNVGWFAAEDPETGEVTWVDSSSGILRQAYKRGRTREIEQISSFCGKNNIDRVEIDLNEPEQPYLKPLILFFKQREKRR